MRGGELQVLQAPGTVLAVKRTDLRLGDLWAISGLVRYVYRIARIARTFDVVYLNSQKAFIIGAIAARLTSRPAIWHQHDLLSTEHFGLIHRRLVATMANHAVAKVIAVSPATAESMRVSGVRADKVHLIYNGVDPGRFDAVDPAGSVVLDRDGTPWQAYRPGPRCDMAWMAPGNRSDRAGRPVRQRTLPRTSPQPPFHSAPLLSAVVPNLITVSIGAQWGTANASNTVTLHEFKIWSDGM